MGDLLSKAFEFFQKVPAAPTNPHAEESVERFDIKDLYEGDTSKEESKKRP